MTAPQLRDPLTGTTLDLDLVSIDLDFPALLPTVDQEEGIPANNTRTRLGTTIALQALATDLPGAGAVRSDLEGQIEAWAASATRLQFVAPNVPVISDLIIGGRGCTFTDTTTGRWSYVLQEVREVVATRGAVAFPRAVRKPVAAPANTSADLKDELAKNEEGGEQSMTPIRRSGALAAAQALGLSR